VDDANPLPSGDLAAFVAAVEAGSIHGAGDTLQLTPSAVTKRVQSLERRTGATLFTRSRQGLRPTDAGRLLYPLAKEALAALRDAEDSVTQLRAHARHILPLAASHTIGEFLLPAWIAAFRAEQPAVRAQIDIINSPSVLLAVREHRAAIGFVEGRDPLDGLEAVTVQRDEIVVVVGPDHRWARRRVLAARELRGEPWLAREAGSGTRAVAAAALRGAGVELTPMLEVASTESVKRALATGGFALLSRLAVATETARGALHAIALKDIDLSRELRAVRDPSVRRTTADARALWAWLAALEG
jgi:DNA-binding transcriptional LysR family regulator